MPAQKIIAPHKQGYLSHSDEEERKIMSPAQQYRNLRKDLVTFNTSEERAASEEKKKREANRLTLKDKTVA